MTPLSSVKFLKSFALKKRFSFFSFARHTALFYALFPVRCATQKELSMKMTVDQRRWSNNPLTFTTVVEIWGRRESMREGVRPFLSSVPFYPLNNRHVRVRKNGRCKSPLLFRALPPAHVPYWKEWASGTCERRVSHRLFLFDLEKWCLTSGFCVRVHSNKIFICTKTRRQYCLC